MENENKQELAMQTHILEGEMINESTDQQQPSFQPVMQSGKNKRKAVTKEKWLMILLIANLALTMLVGIGVVYDIVQQKNATPGKGDMIISPENGPSIQQGGSTDSGPTFKTDQF